MKQKQRAEWKLTGPGSGRSVWQWLKLAIGLMMAGSALWWYAQTPSNAHAWQPDVARLAYAEIDGNRITVHNIRDFHYQSEVHYTPHYYNKTYRLDELVSVDLISSYWMGPHIAHHFLSFGFSDDSFLTVSIETRKEIGEQYSTFNGFFRQYELYYVVASERDTIGLRTLFRSNPPEDVYIYRIQAPLENSRKVFLAYMRSLNHLRETPQFYNTLTDNCTTGIWMQSLINRGHVPFSWKVLLSGHVPEYLYAQGRLVKHLPFQELRHRSMANPRAASAFRSSNFSKEIRRGMPGMT